MRWWRISCTLIPSPTNFNVLIVLTINYSNIIVLMSFNCTSLGTLFVIDTLMHFLFSFMLINVCDNLSLLIVFASFSTYFSSLHLDSIFDYIYTISVVDWLFYFFWLMSKGGIFGTNLKDVWVCLVYISICCFTLGLWLCTESECYALIIYALIWISYMLWWVMNIWYDMFYKLRSD